MSEYSTIGAESWMIVSMPLNDATRTFRVVLHSGSDGAAQRIDVQRTEHGVAATKHIQREFFDSAEYRRIAELGRTLTGSHRRGRVRHQGRRAS